METFLIPPDQTLQRLIRSWTDDGEPTVKTITLPEIRIAPPGMSGNLCRSSHFLPFVPPGTTSNRCATCDGNMTENLGILERDVPLLDQFSAVASRTWWHSSTKSSFHEDPDQTPVHLGSKEAAMERAETLKSEYLYEVELLSDASICPDTYLEAEHFDPGHTIMMAVATKGEIVRYVNNSENPGSISLLTLKNNFKPHRMYTLEWPN